MLKDILIIPLNLKGKDFTLTLYGSSKNAQLFEEENAVDLGESRWQLIEGAEYEYVFQGGDGKSYYFNKHELISPSKSDKTRGIVKTGIYVGNLSLSILDNEGNETEVSFEIRSSKVDYRTDYKTMLHDITSHFTELVMMQGAPTTQRFEVDEKADCRTLYQQFAFLKSLVDSEEFEEALNKILYNPIRKWTGAIIEKDICAVKRLGRRELKQIVVNQNRIPLESDVISGLHIDSIPRRLSVPYKKDTIDVLENRFVKFVLLSFTSFCSNILQLKKASPRLKVEAELVENKLACYLNNNFFREVSDLQISSLNSPALQRREGYREVLQAWMMSKLAAQITWKGGDNVYNAGKRNVSALYEYWVFFKLLDIVKSTFHIEQTKTDEEKLIKSDEDNINLELRQGHMKMIGGICKTPSRILNVRLYYNRTFSNSSDISKSGSWTTNMRPDYTLSIWPGEIKETEAEEQDLIVHIHFDAKYRLHKFLLDDSDVDESTADEDNELSEIDSLINMEKRQEEGGMYKNVDLLKMHAYKDAIRRSSGAYIIYPGTESKNLQGYHEIIPGLGAFCLNPKSVDNDSKELERFLEDVVNHMLNRASQRERISYHTYEVYNNEPPMVNEAMPEPYGINRDLIPEETFVLVGSFRDDNHLKWILKNGLYNTRTGTRNGSLRLKQEIASAKYVLLHKNNTKLLLRLGDNGARVMSKNDLIKKSYSELYKPSHDYYVVFDIANTEPDEEYKNVSWDISRMISDGIIKYGYKSAEPEGVSLATLMQYIIK